MSNKKIPFEVWSADRVTRKTFLSMPTLEDVVAKANTLGINGCVLVLESSGSEIQEDDVLEYYAGSNVYFMLLTRAEEWSPATLLSATPVSSSSNILSNESVVNPINYPSSSSSQTYMLVSEDDFNLGISTSPCSSPCSTLSMSSGALSSSSSTNSAALKLFSKFRVPWEKLPNDISQKLKNKENLGTRMSAFINYTVDELRAFSYFIPLRIFRSVAEDIVHTYPDTFEQRDKDNKIISSFSEVLLTMMRNRNNYLNHISNKADGVKIPIKKRKSVNALRDSVSNWQPNVNEIEGSELSLEEKKIFLSNMFPTNNEMIAEREKILLYMKDCYATQRIFFNNADNYPSIENIQQTWPYIFNRHCLYQHFTLLTSVNEEKVINTLFCQEKQTIRQYFMNSKMEHIKNNLNKQNNDEGILQAIAQYFKEDLRFILQNFPVGTTMDIVKEAIPTAGAWIAVIEHSLESKVAYIFIEKSSVSSTQHVNIMDLVMQCIAYYYNFNLQYPCEMSQSLDFIVRFFLNFYPEKPRGPKKNMHNMARINNLIRKLNNS